MKQNKINKSYRKYIRRFICVAHNKDCFGVTVPHHNRNSSNAGMGCKPKDDSNLVPLCIKHHDEFHRIGKLTFANKYKIDLERTAKVIWEKFRRES